MKKISIFIASPNDVNSERTIAFNTISVLSPIIEEHYNCVLNPVSWPEFSPIASPDPDKVFQDRINQRLKICGIFVGILYRRYGTDIDETRKISGTEMEFNIAIANRKYIKILTYFRNPNYNNINNLDNNIIEQLNKLNSLKKEITKIRVT